MKAKYLLPALIVVGLGGLGYYHFFLNGMQEAEKSYAEVIQLKGKVQTVNAADQYISDVAMGQTLKPGTIVKTGDNSSVTLEFIDTSKLLVASNSRIKFQSLLYSAASKTAETIIYLNAGSAESRVAKQNGFGAKYEVRTPAMQLAVRGTAFYTRYDETTGLANVSVIEGSVEASQQEQSQMLPAGVGLSAMRGKPQEQAKELLQGPEIQPVDSVVVNCAPLDIAWSELQGASEYRVQLLSGENRDAIYYDQLSPENTISIAYLPDDDYLLRIRGLDQKGIEGYDSEQLFTMDARPASPVAESPIAGESIDTRKIKFRWTGSFDATHYHIQISDVSDFSRVITQVEQLPNNMVGFSVPLPPGNYHWRIASINEHQCKGAFSTTQAFTVVQPIASAGSEAERL